MHECNPISFLYATISDELPQFIAILLHYYLLILPESLSEVRFQNAFCQRFTFFTMDVKNDLRAVILSHDEFAVLLGYLQAFDDPGTPNEVAARHVFRA